jgi:hypothetical protein
MTLSELLTILLHNGGLTAYRLDMLCFGWDDAMRSLDLVIAYQIGPEWAFAPIGWRKTEHRMAAWA